MFLNWQVNVAFEVWGILFCLMAATIGYIASGANQNRRMWLTGLFLAQALELLFDAVAWIFRGSDTQAGYYLVRISNAGVFIVNYLLLIISTGYLCSYIKRNMSTGSSFGSRVGFRGSVSC